MMSPEKPADNAVDDGSVVDQILAQFLEKLGGEPGFEDATVRLRETLLEQHEDSEAALRTAVFGGDPE